MMIRQHDVVKRIFVTTCLSCAATALLAAQAAPPAQLANPRPKFEAVSIRPVESTQQGFTIRTQGGLQAPDVHFLALISLAYDVRPAQIIGAPPWLGSDRYAVIGRAEGSPTLPQLQLMLQAMLEERLALVARREKREVQGYRLVVARPGQLGPGLRQGAECSLGAARPGGPCSVRFDGPSIAGRGRTLDNIASNLVAPTGGIVVNGTGLTGIFDFDLRWTPELERAGQSGAAPAIDAPNIFTAVQEQLGLRLEPTRVLTDALVIDSVQRPTDN
jgi:uncharacterized protein (TIGR03435 family)